MERDAETIQREIEHARESLGVTLDQIVVRTSPKRLAAEGRASVLDFVKSTRGKLIIGGTAGAVTALVVIRRLRNR